MGQTNCCSREATEAAKQVDAGAECDGDAPQRPVVSREEPDEPAPEDEPVPAVEAEKGQDVEAVEAPAEPWEESPDLNEPPVQVDAPLDERDITLVQFTWKKAAALGAEEVGKLLFLKIFELAPEALQLFPFKDEGVPCERMVQHGVRVVSIVAVAVDGLGDLPALVPVLQALGLKHVGYAVQAYHYEVVGEALLQTLGAALGENFTPAVQNSWTKLFGVIAKTMISDHYNVVLEALAAKTDGATAAADEPATEAAAEAVEPKGDPDAPAEDATEAGVEPKPEEAAPAEEAADAEKKTAIPKAKAKSKSKAKAKAKAKSGKAKIMSAKERAAYWKALSKQEQQAHAKIMVEFAAAGNVAEVDALLKSGTDVNARNSEGRTALRQAASDGHKDLVEFLVDSCMANTSDVNKSGGGETALHLACKWDKVDVVVYLVKSGVDLTIVNKKGKTAAQIAKNPELAKWMSGPSPAKEPTPFLK